MIPADKSQNLDSKTLETDVSTNAVTDTDMKMAVDATNDSKLDNISVKTLEACSSGRKPPRSSFLAEMPGQKLANTSLVLPIGESQKGKQPTEY